MYVFEATKSFAVILKCVLIFYRLFSLSINLNYIFVTKEINLIFKTCNSLIEHENVIMAKSGNMEVDRLVHSFATEILYLEFR